MGAVRAEYAISDVTQVKVLNDSDAVTLQFTKSSETFTCACRAELLSALLPLVQKDESAPVFTLSKWSGSKMRREGDCTIAQPFAKYKLWAGRIIQRAEVSNTGFDFSLVHVIKVCTLSDDPAAAVLFLKSQKVLVFSCCEDTDSLTVRQFAARDRFVRAVVDAAKIQLGLNIPLSESSTVEIITFLTTRFEKHEELGVVVRNVHVRRYGCDFFKGQVKRRMLELREKCFLERDVEVHQRIRRCFFYQNISLIVRPEDFSDVFGVRLGDDEAYWFSSEERDLILADLLELADRNGVSIVVLVHNIPSSCRVKGSSDLEKDYEDSLLERMSLQNVKDSGSFRQVLDEMIANISISGAARCSSKKPLLALVQALTQIPLDPIKESNNLCDVNSVLISIFAALQKLAHSRACFEEAGLLKKDCTWAALLALVQSSDDLLSFSVVMTLKAFTCYNFSASTQGGSKQEKVRAGIEKLENSNRSCLLDSDMMTLLLSRLRSHAVSHARFQTSSSLLTTHAIMDLLSCIIQAPGASLGNVGVRLAYQPASTQPLVTLLQEFTNKISALCRLNRGPGIGMIRRGSMLLEWIMNFVDTNNEYESASANGKRSMLQDACRNYGQVLWQFYLATASSLPAQQVLSERVIEVLVEDNARSMALLHRMLPSALIFSLSVRWQEPSTAALTSRGGTNMRQGDLASRKAVSNWPLFWQRLRQEVEGAELVWHSRARDELCSTLLSEIESLEAAGGGGGHEPSAVIWNDEEFYVNYNTLKGELKVGRYYVRFLVDKEMRMEAIHGPHKLLGQLFHRFLTEADPAVQIICLTAMARIYQHYDRQPFDRYALASLVRLLQQPCPATPALPSPLSPWKVALECNSGASGLNMNSIGLNEDVAEALLAFLAVAIRNDSNAQTLVLSCDIIPLLVRIASRAHQIIAWDYLKRPALPVEESGRFADCMISEVQKDQLEAIRGKAAESEAALKEQKSKEDQSKCLKGSTSAISLLQSLLSRKGCLSEDNLRLRPLPLAIRILTCQPHFSQVLSLVLSPHPVVLHSVVGVLTACLNTAGPDLLVTLLTYGPVPMLLYALVVLRPDNDTATSIARVLRHFCLLFNISHQSNEGIERSAPRGAMLQDWLPEGLCLILLRDEAWLGNFVEALNWGSEEIECRPWVVWDESMRKKLEICLSSLLGPFIASLVQQPHAQFELSSFVDLPDYHEARDACWLDMGNDDVHRNSGDGNCDIEANPRQMGYYLNSLARLAVTGQALAVAAGDAERLITYVFGGLQASSALSPEQLKKTMKLLQVYSALLQQYSVPVLSLASFVRRLLACCRDLEHPVTVKPDESAIDHRQHDDTTENCPSKKVQLSPFLETMHWALCALATGGLFGGKMQEEISCVQDILDWISDSDDCDLDSVGKLGAADLKDVNDETVDEQIRNSRALIRACTLRCVASVYRSTTYADFATPMLAKGGGGHAGGYYLVRGNIFLRQLTRAILFGVLEEVQAACCCISACCSFVGGKLSEGEDQNVFDLAALLISGKLHYQLLWSLLKNDEKIVSALNQAGHSPSRMNAARQYDENLLPQQCSQSSSTDATVRKTMVSFQPKEQELQVVLAKVDALAAIARNLTRGCGTTAEHLEVVLTAMLTQPLRRRLQDSDAVQWLRCFFGEYHRADLVWGAYNRSLLLEFLTEVIEKCRGALLMDILEDEGRMAQQVDTLRYRNVHCLTPVAGVYLELLPLDVGTRASSSVNDSFDDLQRSLLLGNDVNFEGDKIVPDDWPIEDIDTFVGNVIDMLAHGSNGCAPTTSQAQVALNVLVYLAGRLGIVNAVQAKNSATNGSQTPEIISSMSRAEVLLALLQLPQEDLSLRMLSDQALKLLAIATKTQSAAQFCLTCKSFVPLSTFLAHEISTLLLKSAKVLPPNEAERLLHLLIFASNLARTKTPSVQGALESMVQDGLIEAALLSILANGTDDDFAASDSQYESGSEGTEAICSAICAAASGLVQALVADEAARKGLVKSDSGRDGRWGVGAQGGKGTDKGGSDEAHEVVAGQEGTAALVASGRTAAEARRRIAAYLPGWIAHKVVSGQAGGPMCVLEDLSGGSEQDARQWGREARARAYALLIGTLQRLAGSMALYHNQTASSSAAKSTMNGATSTTSANTHS